MEDMWNLQLFGEEDAPVQEEPMSEEEFEELIHGRGKAQFDARVQKILEGRLKNLRQENGQLKNEAEEQRYQQRQALQQLAEKENEIRQVYPAFNWRAEMENPAFGKLIAAGIDGRTAYEMVHREALMRQAMQYAAKRTGEQMARSIASGAARVGENGRRSGSVSHNDPRTLSSQELANIRQRVMNGEKIRF